ncbi:MAG: hypothetical protein ACLR5S_10660 [Ruminococcus sp.]
MSRIWTCKRKRYGKDNGAAGIRHHCPYNIKREYYKTGFECFQKKFILKRNWIMLVLFSFVCVL